MGESRPYRYYVDTARPESATITDFGPVLLAKVLDLNDTQESSLGLVFHYADEAGLPLLDLKDLRAVLTWLTSDEGKADLKGLGGLSPATAGRLATPPGGWTEGKSNEWAGG